MKLCSSIIGGMSVPKMNNLGEKLYKLEISPIASLKCKLSSEKLTLQHSKHMRNEMFLPVG